MSNNQLFEPINFGSMQLQNRVVLAPLTRMRADENLCVTDLHKDYYSARASAGLLVTEATFIAPQSISSRNIPGCFNEQQAKAWKSVVDGVKSTNPLCKMSLQAWHQGRVAHHSYSKHPAAKGADVTVCESASAVALTLPYKAVDYDSGEFVDYESPKMMTIEDIHRYHEQLLEAARLAFEAGFDYFELHAAHGYLLDQFLSSGVNQREDQYGGSFENRFRIIKEALTLLLAKYPGKIAIRISPHQGLGEAFYGVSDSDPVALYTYVVEELAKFSNLGYVLFTEPRWNLLFSGDILNDPLLLEAPPLAAAKLLPYFRKNNTTTMLIGAGGFTPASSMDAVSDESDSLYQAIAFGRWFISNPDLVFRMKNSLPLNKYDRSTFYTEPTILYSERKVEFTPETFGMGFTDYPTFEQLVKAKLGNDVSVNDIIGNEEKINELIKLTENDPYPLVSLDIIGRTTSSAQR